MASRDKKITDLMEDAKSADPLIPNAALQMAIESNMEKWINKIQSHLDAKFEKLISSINSQHSTYLNDEQTFDCVSTHCSELDILESLTPDISLNDSGADFFSYDIGGTDTSYKEEVPSADNCKSTKDPVAISGHKLDLQAVSGEVSKDDRLISSKPCQPKVLQIKKKRGLEGFTDTSYPIQWVEDPQNVWLQKGVLTRSKKAKNGIQLPDHPDIIIFNHRQTK